MVMRTALSNQLDLGIVLYSPWFVELFWRIFRKKKETNKKNFAVELCVCCHWLVNCDVVVCGTGLSGEPRPVFWKEASVRVVLESMRFR